MNNLSRVVRLLSLVAVTTVPLFAQSPDFSVRIEASIDQQEPADRIAAGQSVDYLVKWGATAPVSTTNLAIEVNVPGVVTSFTPGPAVTCDTGGNPVRCTFGQFLNSDGYVWLHVRIDTPGTRTTTARVIRKDGSSDPNPSNDVVIHTVEVLPQPSVRIISSPALSVLQPSQTTTFPVHLQNRSATPATDVKLAVSLPAGGTILSSEARVGEADCDIANNVLVCTKDSLAMEEMVQIDVSITAPPRMDGEDLVVEMVETQAETDLDSSDNRRTSRAVMVRQFVVENTGDEGAGSLRQAILDVRSLCAVTKPCAILFQIPAPVPENGWFTIQPRTRLPEIPGTLVIDGRTQTLFTGDTNPDGPEIEIDGSFVDEGSGLLLRPHCEMMVRNLAVNGFPGYGMEVRQRAIGRDEEACLVGSSAFHPATIRENYLGTDPRGRIAKPNHRGLGIFTSESYAFENLVSGNRRSGIYVQEGAYHLIGGNKIGVASDGSPLGNGSGIFIDQGAPGASDLNFVGADIIGNVIAHNDGMAIARTRHGEIWISRNSIFDNLQQGIDAGIDGTTPQLDDDRDVPNAPVLFSASYDPAQNATTVRGRVDSTTLGNGGPTGQTGRNIEIYASLRLSGWSMPQAERSVAIVSIPSAHHDFEIVVPGDFRGMWITATHSVTHFLGLARGNPGGPSTETHRALFPGDTSELSNAITVE